jgi:hypothetical protein
MDRTLHLSMVDSSQQMSELDALYGEIRTTAFHLSISE